MEERIDPEGRYTFLDRIGKGSFGEVFKCMDGRSKKIVAVKVIHLEQTGDDLDAIQSEILVLAQCSTPYVTQYYGSYVQGSKLRIIMEYLGGGSVLELIDSRYQRGLDELYIAIILKQILKGLSYLHSQSIVHRDLKAANIMLSDTGEVKIADFGIAKQLRRTLRRQGSRVGTPLWMAPEMIKKVSHNTKVDIWSLGITAIELLRGDPPHAEVDNLRKVFALIIDQPPPRLGEFEAKKNFRHFVEMCLQVEPEDRLSASELIRLPFILKAKKTNHLEKLIRKRKGEIQVNEDGSDDSDNDHVDSNMKVDTDWAFTSIRSNQDALIRAAAVSLFDQQEQRQQENENQSPDSNSSQELPMVEQSQCQQPQQEQESPRQQQKTQSQQSSQEGQNPRQHQKNPQQEKISSQQDILRPKQRNSRGQPPQEKQTPSQVQKGSSQQLPHGSSQQLPHVKQNQQSKNSRQKQHQEQQIPRQQQKNSRQEVSHEQQIPRQQQKNSLQEVSQEQQISRHRKKNSLQELPQEQKMSRHQQKNSRQEPPHEQQIPRQQQKNSLQEVSQEQQLSRHQKKNSLQELPQEQKMSRHQQKNSRQELSQEHQLPLQQLQNSRLQEQQAQHHKQKNSRQQLTQEQLTEEEQQQLRVHQQLRRKHRRKLEKQNLTAESNDSYLSPSVSKFRSRGTLTPPPSKLSAAVIEPLRITDFSAEDTDGINHAEDTDGINHESTSL